MYRVMGITYLGDPRVDNLHRILNLTSSHLVIQRIAHNIFPTSWSHSLFPRLCVDPHTCVDPHSQVVRYCLILFLYSLSQNCSFSPNCFGYRKRCGGVLTMGSLFSSSAVSPHCPHYQRRCCFCQAGLQWFDVHPDVLPAHWGLSLVVLGMLLSPHDGPLVINKSPRSLQILLQHFQVHLQATASVQSTLEFDYPQILVQQLPNTPSHSQPLPETTINFADIW